jgi:hypothetical protein
MTHRYPTRFQARKAVKEQVPVQAISPDLYRNDIAALNVLLDRSSTMIGVARIKNTIDIFAYLSVHTTLLHNPLFRKTVSDKIVEFRQEMENKKKNAIDTFVSVYSPDGNKCYEIQNLMTARSVLYYAPLLEAELNKVESIILQ